MKILTKAIKLKQTTESEREHAKEWARRRIKEREKDEVRKKMNENKAERDFDRILTKSLRRKRLTQIVSPPKFYEIIMRFKK